MGKGRDKTPFFKGANGTKFQTAKGAPKSTNKGKSGTDIMNKGKSRR